MIKQYNIRPNARSRRDASRKARQEAFAAANPLLAGRKYKADTTMAEIKCRAGYYEPLPIKSLAQDAIREREEYRRNLERAAIVFENEIRKPADSKNHRIWYSDPNPLGNKIHTTQKMRGKSIPAYYD